MSSARSAGSKHKAIDRALSIYKVIKDNYNPKRKIKKVEESDESEDEQGLGTSLQIAMHKEEAKEIFAKCDLSSSASRRSLNRAEITSRLVGLSLERSHATKGRYTNEM